MDELEKEDMRRDAYYDATHKEYEVKITVEFTYITHAKSSDEAESEAYDEIEDALRGAYLDYYITDWKSEEVE